MLGRGIEITETGNRVNSGLPLLTEARRHRAHRAPRLDHIGGDLCGFVADPRTQEVRGDGERIGLAGDLTSCAQQGVRR